MGNGVNTRIWGDKWIPIPSSFTVQTPNRILKLNAKVNALKDLDSVIGTEALLIKCLMKMNL